MENERVIYRHAGIPPRVEECRALLVDGTRGSGVEGDEVQRITHIYVKTADGQWSLASTVVGQVCL